jgi:nitroreductase
MEVLEAIKTRRSIRKFKNVPVEQDKVDELLTAAMYAPSAGNEQPWHFILITEEAILSKVPDINSYAAMAKHAPLAVLVCGDLSMEKFPGNWPLDCAAAVQNMLLAAHALGLGAVWTGVYPELDRMKGFKSLLSLPDQVVAHTLVVIGYPDQKIKQPDRYKAERVHENGW